MPTRLAVTGATGQLGRALLTSPPDGWNAVGAQRPAVDIRDWRSVRDWVASTRPHYVIHAAAMTNVDGCETEPDDAYAVNALGTRHVAAAAQRIGATLIYVSTNFVFDGQKESPYQEFDLPNPRSVYGASKLAGEQEARTQCPSSYIVRTAMVYDECGRNFVNTMLRLMDDRDAITVVNDQFGNPTYAADLAAGIYTLVQSAPAGTYHLTNTGSTSWHGWASEIARIRGLDVSIQPIDGASFPRAANVPANGQLTSLAWPDAVETMPHWKDGLRRCLG